MTQPFTETHGFIISEIATTVKGERKVVGYHAECEYCEDHSFDFYLDGSGSIKNARNQLVQKFSREVEENPDTPQWRLEEMVAELNAVNHSMVYVPRGGDALDLNVSKTCRIVRPDDEL